MSRTVKKVLILEGLSCANCAEKIANGVKQIDGVENAWVDFASNRLTIESNNPELIVGIADEATKIANSVESDICVIDTDYVKKETQVESKGLANKDEILRLIIGSTAFIAAILLNQNLWLQLTLYAAAYIIVGGEVLVKAARNIARGQVFDENFLMALATIGAIVIKEYPEAVAVMLFYQIGELFQDAAISKSRKSIKALLDIRPEYANLKTGDEVKKVSPEEVDVGSLIIVKPGERVPLDGNVIQGNSSMDTSALTGESVPREVEPGNEVLSGFINKSGLITVETTKSYGQSTVAKILDMVQNASSKKAPTENFITKFARYYTPAVVIIAAILAFIPPLLVEGAEFGEWINRALVFLVVSCPCALVISVPLGFFGGIGGASRQGILIKGGNYLEALNNIDTVVFDKTGTLTRGVFKVVDIKVFNSFTSEDLIKYSAFAESFSNHPIAISILKEYNREINQSLITEYEEINGKGVRAIIDNKEILAGNLKLMELYGIELCNKDVYGTTVYVAIDKLYAGCIQISDELKADAKKAVISLRKSGVKRIVMLTGDNKNVASKIAEELKLDDMYAELLPQNKVEILEEIESKKSGKGKIAFVGDGINDAPVLARADIGVAMGGLGSDAAIEAADVVLMTDEPSRLVTAINIAKRTKTIVIQNIIFALGIKALVLVMGALGMATMWEAVFADVGVAILAVLNSMRAMKVDNC